MTRYYGVFASHHRLRDASNARELFHDHGATDRAAEGDVWLAALDASPAH